MAQLTNMNSSSRDRILRRRPSLLRRVLFRILITILILSAGGLLTFTWAFGVEPRLLTVTQLTVVNQDLPASWDGKVVAFFSDTHMGESYGVKQLAKVADVINKADPDLILFGGDMVDYRTPTDDGFSSSVSAVLAGMKARQGKFAIVGNHDNRLRAELKLAEEMLENGGFKVLINESAEVDSILVGGLDESYFGKPNLADTFPAGNDEFRLLMMHQPDYAAKLPADSANLILAGHSHNGQITFFGKPIDPVYQGSAYTYGFYELADGRQLVVSRGLGTIGLEARFWSPPEVMLITLRRQ